MSTCALLHFLLIVQVLLNITLLDERDNAPRFSQSIYGPSILENSPTNTIVENVIATDPDGGASIEYMLVDSFSKFAIHQVSYCKLYELVKKIQSKLFATTPLVPLQHGAITKLLL